MTKKKILYIVTIGLAFAAIVGFAVIEMVGGGVETYQVGFNEFMLMAEEGRVAGVTLDDSAIITFIDTDGNYFSTNNPRNPLFKENLLLMGIFVEESGGGTDVASGLVTFGFFAAAFFIIMRVMRRPNGGAVMAMDVKDAAESGHIGIGFSDIAGNEEAKDSVTDVVDFIKCPEKYALLGARMPRGVIFYGPPGTGKTLMAKAIAGEAGVKFFAVSGSDFVQMYVGVGASRVRALFKKARDEGGGVIFIDEIDALAKKRSNVSTGGSDERDQTLNALLTEMSGFNANEGIVVIAATNRLDTLDEALLRPGRFDRQVEINLPDINSRERILRLHSKNKPLAQNVDITGLAKQTVYFSGAMLENLMNEAAITAARKGAGVIAADDVDEAYYSIVAGKAMKNRGSLKEAERRVTAFHEAGHALIAKLSCPENSVPKVTIIPSTRGAGGFCLNIPPDKLFFTKADLEAQLMVSLAGRAAEDLIGGPQNVTTGAAADLTQVAKLASDIVTRYGMSASGLIVTDETEAAREQATLVEHLYERTKALLADHAATLKRIANALLLKETVNETELDGLINFSE